MRRGGGALLVAVGAICCVVPGGAVRASSAGGTIEPNGRGLHLLGAREAILLEQAERSRRSARTRAVNLYRLLRFAAVERGAGSVASGAAPTAMATATATATATTSGADGQRLGGRAVALSVEVLRRDLDEARLLRTELDRVRAERTALDVEAARHSGAAVATPETAPVPAGGFLRPVGGGVVTPFGVGRDRATGAWMFRAAVSFSARAAEPVRCPGAGRVVRVAGSVAGGAAVVLAHDKDATTGGWTTVVSGLDSVAVAPGETVRRGEVLGSSPRDRASSIRIETWRGRTPIDPVSVLRPR